MMANNKRDRFTRKLMITDAIENILRAIGEAKYIGQGADRKLQIREGLIETPERVWRAFEFLLSGYDAKPEDFLKTFDAEGTKELVLLKDIEVYSMCEHHMLPFIGKAHVGYLPNKKIIGVSKLARLVDLFARRLQIQERITRQVTDALNKYIEPLGAACVIEAQHLCMQMRGVEKQNSVMITSSLTGVFMEKSSFGLAARNEFMRLIK